MARGNTTYMSCVGVQTIHGASYAHPMPAHSPPFSNIGRGRSASGEDSSSWQIVPAKLKPISGELERERRHQSVKGISKVRLSRMRAWRGLIAG